MRSRTFLVASSLASFFLVGAARAEVFVVAEVGGDFTTLQPAIDAATDGDVILVRRDFAELTAVVDGKAIAILADTPSGSFFAAKPVVTVMHIPVGKTFVLRGLKLDPQAGNWGSLGITDCDGHVQVEDVSLIGLNGDKNVLVATGGRAALEIEACASVVLHDSSFQGGRGFDACYACLEYGVPLPATHGGPGATVIASQVAAHDVSFLGGTAGALLTGGYVQSGCGLRVTGGSASLSGVVASAGYGIGNGLELQGVFNGPVLMHEVTLAAGALSGHDLLAAPGVMTYPIAGGARHFDVASPVREGQLAQASFHGAPGELVLLAIGLQGDTLPAPPLLGWLEIGVPLLAVAPLGVVPASGVLDLGVPAPSLPPTVDSVTVALQALFATSGGSACAGPSRALVLLSAAH